MFNGVPDMVWLIKNMEKDLKHQNKKSNKKLLNQDEAFLNKAQNMRVTRG